MKAIIAVLFSIFASAALAQQQMTPEQYQALLQAANAQISEAASRETQFRASILLIQQQLGTVTKERDELRAKASEGR